MSSEKKREWFLWGLLVFQYLFSSWLMIGSGALEGIFMKFDNAGIEGNILILILYIFAVFSNGLCVFIFGDPEIINFSRKKYGLIALELSDICDNEKSMLKGETCLYLFKKDHGCFKCPMFYPEPRRFYPT